MYWDFYRSEGSESFFHQWTPCITFLKSEPQRRVMIYSPIPEDKHGTGRFKVSHLSTEGLTRSALWEACPPARWQTGPLWGTLTSAGIKAGAPVFFISSQTDTWIRSLPTLFPARACCCRATPRNPQFTLRHSRSQPVNDWTPLTGFSVSSSDMVFMSACADSLKSSAETETHLQTMNHNFLLASCTDRPSCHFVRSALTAQTEEQRTRSVQMKRARAFLKLMIQLFTQWIAVIFQLRYEGNNYLARCLSSPSTWNPAGQGF